MVDLRPDLWFDVYPYNNPKAGARLVRLTAQQLLGGSFFRVERRGTGSGRIVLNSGQAEFTAANLHEENLVEVGDANVSATLPLGGFFLHRGDLEIISADEQGGEDFPIGGPGLLAYLAREIMWSRTYLTSGGAMDPFDDLWRLSNQGLWAGGRKLGAFAWRAVTECLSFQAGAYSHRHGDGLIYVDTHPTEDRLSSAISLLTMDFNQNTDSAGNAWTPYDGEFNARVKQQLLSVILELVGKGMDVQMRGGRQLTLSAYNSYGRDFRGSSFGAGVVRFAHGVNIANPARRAIEAGLNGSRALVGSNDVYARADAPGGFHVARSIGLDSEAEETAGLIVDGEANLRAREAGSDVPALKVLYGDDPDTGRYQFAPPEVGGHAWVGDLVTIHRGTGAFQWNNADARIEAITFELTDDKLWDDPTIEFGAVYRSADERGRAAAVQAIAGKPHGPHIRICRAVGYAVTVASNQSPDPPSGTTRIEFGYVTPSGTLVPIWDTNTDTAPASRTVAAAVARWFIRAQQSTGSNVYYSDNPLYCQLSSAGGTVTQGWEWTRDLVVGGADFDDTVVTVTAGPSELRGTGKEAAACDHRHLVVRTAPPIAIDDVSAGFRVTDAWLDTTTGDLYVVTDVTAGAAVWVQTSGGVSDHGALSGLLDDDHPQYVLKTDGGNEVANVVAASGAAHTFDLATGNHQHVTLTADCTFTMPAPGPGKSFTHWRRQDATGGRLSTYTGVLWTGGVTPTFSPDPGAVDIVAFLSDGSSWYGVTGAAAAALVGALDDLSDVAVSSPAPGDRLRFDGSGWVNSDLHWEPMVTYDGLVMLDSAGNPHMHEVSH